MAVQNENGGTAPPSRLEPVLPVWSPPSKSAPRWRLAKSGHARNVQPIQPSQVTRTKRPQQRPTLMSLFLFW
jgi:hypothetical protein